MAEPWAKIGRRKQQAGYDVAYDTKHLVIYKLRSSEMEVKGDGESESPG